MALTRQHARAINSVANHPFVSYAGGRAVYDLALQGVKRAGRAYYKHSSSRKRRRASQRSRSVKVERPFAGSRTVRAKRTRYPKRKSKSVKKRLKAIEDKCKVGTGTHVERLRSYSCFGCADNSSVLRLGAASWSVSDIQSILTSLKYYDIDDPANLKDVDPNLGSFSKKLLVKRLVLKNTIKNQTNFPCEVFMVMCTPKKDTNIDPETAFTDGLADVGSPSATGINVYPSDSPTLKMLWKTEVSKKVILAPGESFSLTYASKKPFCWDFAYLDTHADTYQKKFGSAVCYSQIRGTFVHDKTDTANQYGTSQARVYQYTDRLIEVEYDAGAEIKQVVISDDGTAMTAGAIAVNQPKVQNVEFSTGLVS